MKQKSLIDATQRPGFLYILATPSLPNAVRIGATTRVPCYRAAELSSSSGLPEPFKVEYSRFLEKDLYAIENRIHQVLAEQRIYDDRKSFRLSVDEAIEIVDEIIDNHMAYKFGKVTYQHRQHARWGVFFEHIGVRFEYLPEPVHIAGNISFQAHFWLTDQDCFLIISPDFFSSSKGQLAGLYFAQKTGKVLLRFWDCQPGVEPTSDGDIVIYSGQFVTPEGDFDGCIEWGVCPTCGSRHVGHLGHAELCDLASRNTSPKNCQCYNILNPDEELIGAYRMVRHIFDGELLG